LSQGEIFLLIGIHVANADLGHDIGGRAARSVEILNGGGADRRTRRHNISALARAKPRAPALLAAKR
jgi:hypothetical protein